MPFAENTAVPVARSKAEIETLLRKYGAEQFISGWDESHGQEMVQFRCKGRLVRFVLRMPALAEYTTRVRRGRKVVLSLAPAQKAVDQETRRRWRSLALVVKAKLEAVSTGITSFENEFAMHFVMPDGRLVSDHVLPAIAEAYERNEVRALLPEWGGGR